MMAYNPDTERDDEIIWPPADTERSVTVGARVYDPRPALDRQEGGGHYKTMKIQPIEYIHANGIGFAEGTAIKYLSRWRSKGGIEDLRKARHVVDMLIQLEEARG